MQVYICDKCGDNIPERQVWHVNAMSYSDILEKDFEYEYCEVCFNKIKEILEDETDS